METAYRGHRAAAALIAILALLLAACSAAQSPGGEEGEHVTLNIQQSLGAEGARHEFQRIVDAFEDDHPDISVEVSYVPWDDIVPMTVAKMNTDAAPDIVHANSSQGTNVFAEQGLLLDLTDRLAADPELLNDFPPSTFEEFGKSGLPFTIAQEGIIFYRPDLFAEAGISPPEPNEAWTWDEFIDAAKRLTVDTDGDGTVDQWGFVERGQAGIAAMKSYIPYGLSYGTDLVVDRDGTWVSGLAEEPMQEALRTELSMVIEHEVRPQSYLSWQTPEAVRAWNGDQLAMLNIGAWFSGTDGFEDEFGSEYDVMLFPTDDPTNRSVYTAYNYFHIFKSSEHPDEAWEFLQFLYDPERLQALAQAQQDTIPVTTSASSHEHYNAENYPLWSDRLSGWMEFASYTPSYPDYPNLWQSAVNPVMESAAQGNTPIDDAIGQMAEAIDSELGTGD